jgi:hypothetical protein
MAIAALSGFASGSAVTLPAQRRPPGIENVTPQTPRFSAEILNLVLRNQNIPITHIMKRLSENDSAISSA